MMDEGIIYHPVSELRFAATTIVGAVVGGALGYVISGGDPSAVVTCAISGGITAPLSCVNDAYDKETHRSYEISKAVHRYSTNIRNWQDRDLYCPSKSECRYLQKEKAELDAQKSILTNPIISIVTSTIAGIALPKLFSMGAMTLTQHGIPALQPTHPFLAIGVAVVGVGIGKICSPPLCGVDCD